MEQTEINPMPPAPRACKKLIGGEKVSDKEKQMLEKISKLPAALQEKFVDRLQGAVMALDVLDAAEEKEKPKPKE